MNLESAILFDKGFFFFADTFHFRRMIFEPGITYQYPKQANKTINEKSGAPTIVTCKGNNNDRSNHQAYSLPNCCCVNTSCSFSNRKPAGNDASRGRKNSCFSHSKKKSDNK